jgi:hypothetical protein
MTVLHKAGVRSALSKVVVEFGGERSQSYKPSQMESRLVRACHEKGEWVWKSTYLLAIHLQKRAAQVLANIATMGK